MFRVEKTGGSYPTETIYFQGKPIALLNATSGAWTDLIWAGGGLIAEVAGTQTALPSYRLLDHEGSLAMTTDGSGNVTGTNNLSPYGETLSSNTNDSFSYAGLTQDTEYGGDAATFRNYSTEQVRWTRPDPYDGSYDLSNPQSMNRYVYAMNNPLNNIDPSGQQDENGAYWMLQYEVAGGEYIVDGMEVSEFEYNMLLSSGAVSEEIIGSLVPTDVGLIQSKSNGCEQNILDAVNDQSGENYTSANVVGAPWNYSTGEPSGEGTLNLNISGSTAGISPGYYPVNWWTYVVGVGPTLHAVSGPGGHGGLDSPQTLQFGPNQATFHIDSGYVYNPIGAVFHWLMNMTSFGGYPPC